ncbi:TetR/AcrR family transcriptional regulator [Streptomyces sp. NPDC012888]|uniref:TetR/AcrR family transcriptional regulator n=1 Tax=Streptomyces sp. NPDC012888 TaxID=3364855 RepID=UPI0036BF647B
MTTTTTAALGTRDRLISTASRLMQHGGYESTPIKQLVKEAGATMGSLYHFFPGGKQELAVAAIAYGDEEFAELLRTGLALHADPAEAVGALTELLAEALEESMWRDGCPVTATALESVGRMPEVQAACAAAYANWERLVEEKLLACGLSEEDSRDLAMTVLNTLGGAETAAQVGQSRTPLLVAGRHLSRLIASYVPASD